MSLAAIESSMQDTYGSGSLTSLSLLPTHPQNPSSNPVYSPFKVYFIYTDFPPILTTNTPETLIPVKGDIYQARVNLPKCKSDGITISLTSLQRLPVAFGMKAKILSGFYQVLQKQVCAPAPSR